MDTHATEKARIRSITVERWPERWTDRLVVAIWIAWLYWDHMDRTTAWLLIGLVALSGLLLIGQAWRIQ